MAVQAVHQLHQMQGGDFADFLARQALQEFLVGPLEQQVKGLQIAALSRLEFLVKRREKLSVLQPGAQRAGMNPDLLGDGFPAELAFGQQFDRFSFFSREQSGRLRGGGWDAADCRARDKRPSLLGERRAKRRCGTYKGCGTGALGWRF